MFRPSVHVLFVTLGLAVAGCVEDETVAPHPEPGARDATPAPEDTPDDADDRPVHRRAADLPTARTEVTGAVWNGRIVAVGGLDDQGHALANVDVYDPDRDAWTSGPDLPVGLHHTAVATLGDRLYVVGGYSIDGGAWVAEAAVRSLGPDEDQWRDEPSLATPRGALAVASTSDGIVAVGGVDRRGEVLASTEVFHDRSWEAGPEMATPREHLAATAVGEDVYAIAGRIGGLDTNHASVELLRDGRWRDAPALEFARGGIGAADVEDRPCVAGGEEPGATIAPVECLTDDGWEVVADLEVPRHGLVVAAHEDALHVVGGGTEPGLTISGVHEIIPVDLR